MEVCQGRDGGVFVEGSFVEGAVFVVLRAFGVGDEGGEVIVVGGGVVEAGWEGVWGGLLAVCWAAAFGVSWWGFGVVVLGCGLGL